MRLANFIRRLPWSVVGVAFLLMVVGCAAIARSETLTESAQRLSRQQVVWTVLAMAMMFLAAVPSYRVLGRYSYLVFGVALFLLVAVYFAPTVNGAHRWLRLGRLGIQPSELAKVALVMSLARWLSYGENIRTLPGLLVPLAMTLVPTVLILREPDLGTSLVLPPVLAAMLLAAGARPRHLWALGLIGMIALPLLWTGMSREQKSRVTALLSPTAPNERPDDDGFHLHRAKQTLAVGGVWGSWLREWRGGPIEADGDPGAFLVPAAATDSILCIVVERYGLVGMAGVLMLYALLVSRSLAIARRTQEPFGRLLCVGVAALLAVQVLVNTAMMVGLLPITGLPLPLVSYGGSALLAQSAALGLLLNVGLRPGYDVAGAPFRFVERRAAA